MVERADGQQGIGVNFLEQAGFKPNANIAIKREDLDRVDYLSGNEDEVAFRDFLRHAAAAPNLKGVALSSIKYGGIYTTWIIGDEKEEEMPETLRTIFGIGNLLTRTEATRDIATAGSILRLGDRGFEEAVNKLREERARKSSDLKLLGVIEFE